MLDVIRSTISSGKIIKKETTLKKDGLFTFMMKCIIR